MVVTHSRSVISSLVVSLALVLGGCVTSTGAASPTSPWSKGGAPEKGGPDSVSDPGGPDAGIPGTGSGVVPAWVQPGARATWYLAAASVAQSRFSWVEDPDGDWRDPVTGKRYRRTDEPGSQGQPPQDQPTASGDGLSQIDVLGVEGNDVVLSTNAYGIEHLTNQFVVAATFGGRVPGGAVDGAWIHPDQLKQLEASRLGGMLIVRGPWSLGATTYDAIAFATMGPGASQSYVYDSQSGILLSANTSTAGATSPVTAAGDAPAVGNTQLTHTRFMGLRQRSAPGVGGTNPAWVRPGVVLPYGGTYNFTNPVDPSSANFTYPLELTVELGESGSDWAAYSARSVLGMPGAQPTEQAGVTGTFGLYWMDPAALGDLTEGQILDEDPFTGERFVVDSVRASSGGQVVDLASQLPGVSTLASYDQASGVLTGIQTFEAPTGTTIQLQLQQMP